MSQEIRKLVDDIRAAWNQHDAPGFAAQFLKTRCSG